MQNPIIKRWQEHRELTASAIAGQVTAFRNQYGYVPKCVYRNRKTGRKND